jgi:hypothetical protein
MSKNRCAKAIRKALNAAGIKTPHNPVPAADYLEYLPKLGFNPVGHDGYKPKNGDIAVFPRIPRSDNEPVYGHIEMYNESIERWQSDFIQRPTNKDGIYGKGFFVNRKYAKLQFTIFRKED